MQRSIFKTSSPKASKEYSFNDQEFDYALFRPSWPTSFAIAALERAKIDYRTSTPVVVIIGSGAGADAKPFLELGCVVYAIEPNHELRKLAVAKLAEYKQFYSINGNAHQLNLPAPIKADLIVCAQALHTFSGEVLGNPHSEGEARSQWQTILPDDNEDRVSIWYYNIDAASPHLLTLHQTLIANSKDYAKSKTQFLDATMFEPTKFQHYIQATNMQMSTAQHVDDTLLTPATYMRWLRSYSFYPKDKEEIAQVTVAMNAWFDLHKNDHDEIKFTYIGFIAQGPLRKTPHLNLNPHIKLESPITHAARMAENKAASAFWPSTDNILRFSNRDHA